MSEHSSIFEHDKDGILGRLESTHKRQIIELIRLMNIFKDGDITRLK